MADKKKSGSGSVNDQDKSHENDLQFLDQANIKCLVQDSLSKLIANRPDDPLTFLAEYFEALDEQQQQNQVQKALQVVQMTHHSRAIFDSNVSKAYNILSKPKSSKMPKGVSGAVYNEFLHNMLKEMDSVIVSRLLNKIECYDYEAVPYDLFRSSVFTCCVLQDYHKLAKSLFHSLDIDQTGKADKIFCNVVLEQLQLALSSRNSTTSNLSSVFDAGYRLSADSLHKSFETISNRLKNHPTLSCEQFVIEACDMFISNVKRLN